MTMNNSTTTQRGVTRLLNFVKGHDPVARPVGDGSIVQIIRPELDLGGDFIKLAVERQKTKLLVHDGTYTLGFMNSLDDDNLREINDILAEYGVDPLSDGSHKLQIRTSRADYPENRDRLCQAIVAVERLFQGA